MEAYSRAEDWLSRKLLRMSPSFPYSKHPKNQGLVILKNSQFNHETEEIEQKLTYFCFNLTRTHQLNVSLTKRSPFQDFGFGPRLCSFSNCSLGSLPMRHTKIFVLVSIPESLRLVVTPVQDLPGHDLVSDSGMLTTTKQNTLPCLTLGPV